MVRINFEVTPEFRGRYNKTIPRGARGEVMRALLEMTLDLVDKHGDGVLTLIVDRAVYPLTGAYNAAGGHKKVS